MSAWLYQCRACHRLWDPMRESSPRCVRCDAVLYYEALDTWSFAGNEIDVERLRNVVASIAIAAGLCRSYELGDDPPPIGPGRRIPLKYGQAWIPDALWFPGCGKEAP